MPGEAAPLPSDPPPLTLFPHELEAPARPEEPSLKIILFRLGPEWYGLPARRAREVLPVNDITPLPSLPDHLAGIVNIRGNLLSVTDLKRLLGLPTASKLSDARLIVVESGSLQTGLLVDAVDEVVDVPVSRIQPVMSTLDADQAQFFEGQCEWRGRLVSILLTDKVIQRRKAW